MPLRRFPFSFPFSTEKLLSHQTQVSSTELPCHETEVTPSVTLGVVSLQPVGSELAPATISFLGTWWTSEWPWEVWSSLWIILFVLNLNLFWNHLLRSPPEGNALVAAVKPPCCPAPQPQRCPASWRSSCPVPQLMPILLQCQGS